ncbi:MAG: exodeoxyribonuclease VII small subunit [Clostridiales bacterium]|nr:exodeoxyribonuclease VII small subunit [Clostridiales bacterium]
MGNEVGISKLKFEEAITELEMIIEKIEGSEIPLTLEESVELYKRGVLLSQHCKQILDLAHREINILTKNQDEELEEIPFQDEDYGEI